MVRRVEHRKELRGTLIGEISPEFLWGTLDQSMPSATTLVRVVDDSGRVLFSSTTASQIAREDLIPRPEVAADHASPGHPALRPLALATGAGRGLLRRRPGTSCSASRGPRSSGRWCRFTRTFLLVVLLSGTAVLLLSMSQIRRSLLPLHELQEGTQRIAHRDFGSRVAIRSRDEFEELGASFNAMAGQLDRQFQALATAAEIDRAVLSATDASDIVSTLLGRMRDVYPCSMVSVTLVAPDGAKSLPSLVHDYGDGARRQVRVDLRSADVQDLLDGPEAMVYDPDDEPAGSIVSDAAGGARARAACSSCRFASSASWSASSRSATGAMPCPTGRPGAGAAARRSGRGGARQRPDAASRCARSPTTTV